MVAVDTDYINTKGGLVAESLLCKDVLNKDILNILCELCPL